jgi:curved DNA-binding protein CbpA
VDEALLAQKKEIREVYQTLKVKNHFEILGIPKASSEAQVKDAYFRLAKRYHPDTQRDSSLAELKQEMDAIFIRLGEAYEVLRSPSSRSAYESDLVARTPRIHPQTGAPEPAPPPPGQNAEELIRKAEKLMSQDKTWDAIQILEQAVPAGEGRMKAKARVLLARCYLKNPKWVHRAEEVLQAAVRDDPKYAEPYFVLGTIYKGGGLKSRAVSMFKKALEMKPDHEAATQELAGLEAAEPPESPPPPEGFLKKLFGKP